MSAFFLYGVVQCIAISLADCGVVAGVAGFVNDQVGNFQDGLPFKRAISGFHDLMK
jgi:hypothetical protein